MGSWLVMRTLPAVGLVLFAGCAGRVQPPPTAGYERGAVPDLRGSRVLVLPLQLVSATHPDVGRELEYTLAEGDSSIEWVMPDALRDALVRSPGADVRIDDLPVSVFLAGEVDRVGDPLFGALYRLGALMDARVALLPVEARARTYEDQEVVEISAALLDVRTGRVLWFGVVEGERGAPGAISLAATAAEALSRRLGP